MHMFTYYTLVVTFSTVKVIILKLIYRILIFTKTLLNHRYCIEPPSFRMSMFLQTRKRDEAASDSKSIPLKSGDNSNTDPVCVSLRVVGTR